MKKEENQPGVKGAALGPLAGPGQRPGGGSGGNAPESSCISCVFKPLGDLFPVLKQFKEICIVNSLMEQDSHI